MARNMRSEQKFAVWLLAFCTVLATSGSLVDRGGSCNSHALVSAASEKPGNTLELAIKWRLYRRLQPGEAPPDITAFQQVPDDHTQLQALQAAGAGSSAMAAVPTVAWGEPASGAVATGCGSYFDAFMRYLKGSAPIVRLHRSRGAVRPMTNMEAEQMIQRRVYDDAQYANDVLAGRTPIPPTANRDLLVFIALTRHHGLTPCPEVLEALVNNEVLTHYGLAQFIQLHRWRRLTAYDPVLEHELNTLQGRILESVGDEETDDAGAYERLMRACAEFVQSRPTSSSPSPSITAASTPAMPGVVSLTQMQRLLLR